MTKVGDADALVSVDSSVRMHLPVSDVSVPEQFFAWRAWDRQDDAVSLRPERAMASRIETAPTATTERSFWSRGGEGLLIGGTTLAIGLTALFWWNPVGWAAGASAALMIGAGLAASAASAIQLAESYSGNTTEEQDAAFRRANSAALAFSSPGGVLGGVGGTVFADDPVEGFETGALWGGLAEGAGYVVITVPGALRAVPGLWRGAMPWAKSLLLTPAWFAMGIGGGAGNLRTTTRAFAAQGRLASRIRTVEYVGTTPLLVRDAAWAKYQVGATGSAREAVFRITSVDGSQRIVLADRYLLKDKLILEAKYGDMGQMFDPLREAHIIRQARNYLDIATVTDSQVGYLVSTARGTSRLSQRFSLEFPEATQSGQLWVDWVQWRR
jgi:hypothetical protein